MDTDRAHPLRTEQVLARAISTALDPTISSDARVDEVVRVAHGDRRALEAALRRLEAKTGGRPSGFAASRAVTSLQLALVDTVSASHN